MAITSAEIQFRLSGGASNTVQSASLGGIKSTSVASTQIFDDVTGTESANGDTEYRALYVHNSNASLTLMNAVAWLAANTPSTSTDAAIGLGTSAVNGTEQTVASEDTAPSGVTFSAAASKAAGIALGDIPAGQSRCIWIRRVVTAGAPAVSSDGFTVRVEGDTAA